MFKLFWTIFSLGAPGWSFGKNYSLSFLTIVSPFIIRVSGWRLVCSVVTIVFDEVRTKILCIHTKLIIVFIVVYVWRVFCGRKIKDVLSRSIMDDIIWKKRLDLTISGIKAK